LGYASLRVGFLLSVVACDFDFSPPLLPPAQAAVDSRNYSKPGVIFPGQVLRLSGGCAMRRKCRAAWGPGGLADEAPWASCGGATPHIQNQVLISFSSLAKKLNKISYLSYLTIKKMQRTFQRRRVATRQATNLKKDIDFKTMSIL
jgi:hypothetical protein